MKNIINFIRWQWRKWDLWQKCFIVGAFFGGSGFVAPAPYGTYILMIPTALLFVFTFKWWMWDSTVESYKKYQAEKSNLFETIKTSDQK